MKIKKYLPYILILIMLVGFFAPILGVYASSANPNEPCVYNATPGSGPVAQNEPCNDGNGATSNNATTNVCSSLDGIGNLICKFHQILNSIIPALVALGVVYFVWGVISYVVGGDDEAKKKGKDKIIYGVIGLTVIVGLWGIVNIFVTTFDLGGASAPTLQPLTGASSTCNLDHNPKFQDLLCYITRIINDSVIPLIFALAVAMFVWGVVQFVINSSEEAKKEKGRQFMIWGIIALTVMISVWGLVAILGDTFGIDGSILPQVKP